MRLIDADKLPATCNVAIVNGKVEVNGWIAANRINEAPTVEAIPVEWIKKYYTDITSPYTDTRIQFEEMIRKWEKENEIDKCR